jgi:hypothetical protein
MESVTGSAGYKVVSVSEWIVWCPPDRILAFWKECSDAKQDLDTLVSMINKHIAHRKICADRKDVIKKCQDIEKGLKRIYEKITKNENGTYDQQRINEVRLQYGNRPRELAGMGKKKADYEKLLDLLS